jgi:hypothetical protein
MTRLRMRRRPRASSPRRLFRAERRATEDSPVRVNGLRFRLQTRVGATPGTNCSVTSLSLKPIRSGVRSAWPGSGLQPPETTPPPERRNTGQASASRFGAAEWTRNAGACVTPFDFQSESAEALETSYWKDLRLYCGFGVTSRAVDEPTTAGPAGSSREAEPAGRDGLALASHVGRLQGAVTAAPIRLRPPARALARGGAEAVRGRMNRKPAEARHVDPQGEQDAEACEMIGLPQRLHRRRLRVAEEHSAEPSQDVV